MMIIKEKQKVEELSDIQLGYVYLSNTSGQGQLADRFLELLQRPVVYNLHWRHGKDHICPIKSKTGQLY